MLEVDALGQTIRRNEDALRRDFTINAMYYDPETQTVVDYHGGIKDAKKRTIRMIGDPLTRYREDPVRVIRAVRFAAKLHPLGFTLDPKTAAPLVKCQALLADVPQSRLFDEMLKLLQTGHSLATIGQLKALGMSRGWPVAVGGTQAIADALAAVVTEHGGKIHLEEPIEDLSRFKAADAIVLNLTPAQVLRLKGVEVVDSIERKMKKWRYGPPSYKIDFLLDGPIPWKNPEVANATTVHVCGSADEIRLAEAEAAAGRMPERPFVLVCQQQAADPSRAREGKHVVWAYAHVPRGFVDKRAGVLIANQIERFAPGFRDRVIQAVTTDANQLEDWNPNLVGGDVAAGATDGLQSIVRMPSKLGPKTYMASASNAPGGGVHGMPGAWAARAVLADHH